MREYQIPRNVSSKFEFWPGFGWVSLFITVAGLATGVVLHLLMTLFTPSPWSLLLVVLGGSLGYGLVRPFGGPGADSFLETMQRLSRFKARRKLYLHQRRRNVNCS